MGFGDSVCEAIEAIYDTLENDHMNVGKYYKDQLIESLANLYLINRKLDDIFNKYEHQDLSYWREYATAEVNKRLEEQKE